MTEPLILRVARLCEGLTEVVGPGSNPVILQWARAISAPAYTDDDIAWCAIAMNRWFLTCAYPLAGTGYDLLRAKSVERWGTRLSSARLGAVQVFSRPGGYHTGLYLGERADAYYVLGGNTANAVGATWIAKDRLTATCWPLGEPVPAPQIVQLTDDGEPVSANES